MELLGSLQLLQLVGCCYEWDWPSVPNWRLESVRDPGEWGSEYEQMQLLRYYSVTTTTKKSWSYEGRVLYLLQLQTRTKLALRAVALRRRSCCLVMR